MNPAWRFVVAIGLVSLFADLKTCTYAPWG